MLTQVCGIGDSIACSQQLLKKTINTFYTKHKELIINVFRTYNNNDPNLRGVFYNILQTLDRSKMFMFTTSGKRPEFAIDVRINKFYPIDVSCHVLSPIKEIQS